MLIGDTEINAVVFYDRTTKELCAMVTDTEYTIPENCEIAIFSEGTEPLFKDEDGMVKLKGAIVEVVK